MVPLCLNCFCGCVLCRALQASIYKAKPVPTTIAQSLAMLRLILISLLLVSFSGLSHSWFTWPSTLAFYPSSPQIILSNNMSAPQINTDQWLQAAKYRRSIYGLKDTSAVSDARLEEIITEVLSFTPSSYNTQPARISLVLGEKHKQFWDVVIEAAEPILKGAGPGVWESLAPRFQAFKGAYGSV